VGRKFWLETSNGSDSLLFRTNGDVLPSFLELVFGTNIWTGTSNASFLELGPGPTLVLFLGTINGATSADSLLESDPISLLVLPLGTRTGGAWKLPVPLLLDEFLFRLASDEVVVFVLALETAVLWGVLGGAAETAWIDWKEEKQQT
jgi:hypothetical protein